MRSSILVCLAALGFVLTGVAAAGQSDTQIQDNHMLPVLVQVNSDGQVTEIEPPFRLKPGQMRALEQTVKQMVTGPAVHDGHPVSSQFLATFRVSADPDHAGSYDLTYSSATVVPNGRVHWVDNGPHRTPRYQLVSKDLAVLARGQRRMQRDLGLEASGKYAPTDTGGGGDNGGSSGNGGGD